MLPERGCSHDAQMLNANPRHHRVGDGCAVRIASAHARHFR
jgi:hypothetical protein